MRTTRSHRDLVPEAFQALMQMYRHTRTCGLEHGLLHLIEIRASQLNGCAYCVDMHSGEALQAGEDPRRLHLLATWREAPCFSARERAALAWTEALTDLPRHLVTEELYRATREQFSEVELVNLTHAIALINSWNRIGVAFLPDLPAFGSRA